MVFVLQCAARLMCFTTSSCTRQASAHQHCQEQRSVQEDDRKDKRKERRATGEYTMWGKGPELRGKGGDMVETMQIATEKEK
jgi:hypothetical protein